MHGAKGILKIRRIFEPDAVLRSEFVDLCKVGIATKSERQRLDSQSGFPQRNQRNRSSRVQARPRSPTEKNLFVAQVMAIEGRSESRAAD